MEEAFRAVLLAESALTALVPADRLVWGDVVSGRTYPLVTLMVVDGAEGLAMTSRTGLWQGRVQIDCYAATMAAAKQISRLIVNRLHGWNVSARPGLAGIIHLSTRDGREGSTNEADRPFRVGIDFAVNWRT